MRTNGRYHPTVVRKKLRKFYSLYFIRILRKEYKLDEQKKKMHRVAEFFKTQWLRTQPSLLPFSRCLRLYAFAFPRSPGNFRAGSRRSRASSGRSVLCAWREIAEASKARSYILSPYGREKSPDVVGTALDRARPQHNIKERAG